MKFTFIKVSIFIFIVVFGVQKVVAQGNSLSGKVYDSKSNHPLPQASVYIPDLKLGVIADSSGDYHFKGLPIGNYLVQVQYVGFKVVTKNIAITGKAAAKLDFPLSDEAAEESAVIVTGLSKATQIKRSPVPIVSVSHEYIVSNLSTNIIDAIAKVPGVSALTTGPNVSKPFIRGLGYNRILTLYDGVRQEGQQWGDEHGIEVDQYGIDRVEVIKGPASLTYGSDALAGVVNLIPTAPAPEGKMVGNVTTEYESNNGMFGGSAMLGAAKNGFEWMGRLSHKQAYDYENKTDGRVYNTAFNETDADLALGLHRSWGYSHLNISLYDDLQEIPDGSRDSIGQFTKQITVADTYRPVVSPSEFTQYGMTPLHQHVQHYRAYIANSFRIGEGRLAVNVGAQRSVRREYDNPELPYQDVPGLYLELNTYSYDVKYFAPEFDGWGLTVGINGMYQQNTVTKGTDFIIPSYNQFDIGPFAMIKKSFDKLDISGGIRYDSRSFNNDGLYTTNDAATGFDTPVYGADTVGANHPFSNYSHVFSGASGSFGATYNFNDKLSVKLNVSRGYRAPNISEISANGVHPGTNLYQIGNPDFKPEFSLQEDIGLAYTSKSLIINFSVFDNTITNYIYNQRLSSVFGGDSVIVAGNQTYKFQQGKANLYGGELSIDIHPVKALHFENTISAVYALNESIDAKQRTDSNRYLPQIPPVHGVSELRYDFDSKRHHIVNGFVKAGVAYYTTQNRVYLVDNTETRTPGYALLEAGAGAGFTNKKGKKIVDVYVLGNNLTNVSYFDHLSRLKYFYYSPSDTNPAHSWQGIHNMGRNISLKLSFPLDFSYN